MKLFTKTSILVFSIIGSTLFGALLFSDNLKQVDKKKYIPAIILFGLLWNILILKLLKPLAIPYLPFTLANLSGGLLLIGPIWKNYLNEETTFLSRKIWGPLLSLLVLYGAIALMIFSYRAH